MKYEATGYKSWRDDDGDVELMANFVATIAKETRFVDGLTNKSVLTLTGEMPDPENEDGDPIQLPPVEVDADAFASMSWVMQNWGVRCVIRPGSGIKDDLRTMIQLSSKPAITTIYKQTGWVRIGGKPVYLHVGGGIGAGGNDRGVTVRLPPELSRYDLSSPAAPQDAFRASLAMLDLTRPDLTWPLFAATLAPLYGPVDFAIHLAGRTGSFKSELMSLYQSHYGAGMDARHLPGSWSSTANAIEALAFFACNAAFVLDDFVPTGTAYQQRAYQQNADKIIRAQGNQAGRARLSDTSNLQQTMFPRGIILSTGEDVPEGHSVRARMLILEVAAGDIDAADLTAAQKNRPLYPGTVAWLAQSLAKSPDTAVIPRTEELRTAYRSIGHSRTPGTLGRLVATLEDMFRRAVADGLISEAEAKSFTLTAKQQIEAAGAKQPQYLEDADPVDMFMSSFRQVLASGLGHVRSLNGGVPLKAEALGWTAERAMGEMSTFKARGPTIAWCNWKTDELFIDVTAGYNVIKKVAGPELALSKQTLFKRMKDAGLLSRTDDGRQRNTIRVRAENHPRQVLCMSITAALNLEDVTDVESDTNTRDAGDASTDDYVQDEE